MLKHGILGLLNYGEMTGYEIKEVFACSLNFFWTAQTSQIYRELQTIEKKHWAKSTLIMQEGKPDKKVFKITDEGKEELLHY
jgi:DNA-binding PadR family transcriptional regulator